MTQVGLPGFIGEESLVPICLALEASCQSVTLSTTTTAEEGLR